MWWGGLRQNLAKRGSVFSQSIGKMLLSLGVSRHSVSISGIAFDLVQVKQQIIEQQYKYASTCSLALTAE